MRPRMMETGARWKKSTADVYLIWPQASDTVKVRIDEQDVYYLRARYRKRPFTGRATMRNKAIEIYVRFPDFASGKYPINGAIIFLRQLGIHDVSLFIEMCQVRGWAVE